MLDISLINISQRYKKRMILFVIMIEFFTFALKKCTICKYLTLSESILEAQTPISGLSETTGKSLTK